MDWNGVKGLVGKFAPWIATSLGGPAAGMGVKALCGALGLDPATTKPEDVEALFKQGQLTGDQLLAMKNADQTFQLQMKTLDLGSIKDLEGLAVDDRKSAREMRVATNDNTPQILAYMGLGVWTVLNGSLIVMSYKGISLPTDMSPIIMRVLGTMDALLGMAFGFFFGTTANSKAKDNLLYKSTPTD